MRKFLFFGMAICLVMFSCDDNIQDENVANNYSTKRTFQSNPFSVASMRIAKDSILNYYRSIGRTDIVSQFQIIMLTLRIIITIFFQLIVFNTLL